MSWYVLNCKTGQEEDIVRSCRQHLSPEALEAVFTFQCERYWRREGIWQIIKKEMFPGYVFLQSSRPEVLSGELERYRTILRVMEESGYLISVYQEEEENLRALCGRDHFLKLSYGYKKNGVSRITEGPLRGKENHIIQLDWHRRFAQLGLSVADKKSVVWAGLGIAQEACR